MSDLGELARRAAVILACPERQSLVVTGPERLTWLDGLLTCELKTLSPGSGTWGLSLNRQGKIQTELWAVATAEALWLSLAPATREATHAELDRMLIMEDAELLLPERETTWFALHGPEASTLAKRIADRHDGFATAIDWLGLGGAALCLPAAAAAEAMAAEQERLIDAAAWLELRLERSFPVFGTDYDPRDRPHEAALDRRAVSWTKGCYLGQEVVCMQDMRGKVRRSNRVLAVNAPRDASLPVGGDVLGTDGKVVGTIRSAAYSTRAGTWLAMCRVDLSSLEGPLGIAAGDASPHPAQLAESV